MSNLSTRQFITLATALLLLPVAATATTKEGDRCALIRQADKRLECYDRQAQQDTRDQAGDRDQAEERDKAGERDSTCKESVLSRLGGGLFRSFPRQRELW